jgi:hypothetical protein
MLSANTTLDIQGVLATITRLFPSIFRQISRHEQQKALKVFSYITGLVIYLCSSWPKQMFYSSFRTVRPDDWNVNTSILYPRQRPSRIGKVRQMLGTAESRTLAALGFIGRRSNHKNINNVSH